MRTQLDRNARKFHLSQPLGLRQSRELETIVSRHPAFDHLCPNLAYSAFTLRLTDANYWVTAGNNILELIDSFLREYGISYEQSSVYQRLAA